MISDRMNMIMTKKNKLFNYLINLCFFLYFITLIVERSISFILSLVNHVNIYGDGFNGYTYTLVFISFIGWLAYLIVRCKGAIKALFKSNSDDVHFVDLCIASGILLLSGMVHTEYTIAITQFIAYGILIVGILLKVIMINQNSKNKPLLWLSFIYLVCLSMAIPVMYPSFIEIHVLFHITEAITSLLMVAIFTYLLILLFKDKDNLFILWPIIVSVVLDAILIIMRWNEEINWFVLIFISLSLIMFIIGYIVSMKKKKN